MKPSEFIHPDDAAALRQLESIPGFPTLVKKFYALGYEKFFHGMKMASNIKLSKNQLPELYRHLPPICRKLGIAEPDFYLEMDPNPNAYTYGDTKIFVVVTSGLVEMMDDQELDAVIGHECGHILCRHVLYHNMAEMLLRGADSFGLLGFLTTPIQLGLLYWMRKSELSCDRAGAIVTSPEVVSRTMLRLAGGPRSITDTVNMEEWAKQAEQYEDLRTSNAWNKFLQAYAVMGSDHPFSTVRAREVMKWGNTKQYENIINGLAKLESSTCPNCHAHIEESWKFCRNCGHKLGDN